MQGSYEKNVEKRNIHFFDKFKEMTHVFTSNFQGLFENVVFRCMALIRFFNTDSLFTLCNALKEKVAKNPFN